MGLPPNFNIFVTLTTTSPSKVNDNFRILYRIKYPYGFFGGGDTGSASNVIDYIDVNLLVGNATDKGDLTVARNKLAGVSGRIYGFYGGGDNGSDGGDNGATGGGDKTLRDIRARMDLLNDKMDTIQASYEMVGIYPTSVGDIAFTNSDPDIATFDATFKFQYWRVKELNGSDVTGI